MRIQNMHDNDAFDVLLTDVSVEPDSYQHFILTGSTFNIMAGSYPYQLFAATGSTTEDIIDPIIGSGIINFT